MKKVDSRTLVRQDNKLYWRGELFTGISSTALEVGFGFLGVHPYGHLETEIVRGVASNKCEQFYNNGQLSKSIHHELGDDCKATGKFETYYDNGQLCEKGEIIERRLHGRYECFFENGYRFIEAEFNRGSATGEGMCYYRTGMLCQEGDIDSRHFTAQVSDRLTSWVKCPTTGDSRVHYGIRRDDKSMSDDMYRNSFDFEFIPYPKLCRNYLSRNIDTYDIIEIKEFVKKCYEKNGDLKSFEAYNESLQKHGQSSTYFCGMLEELKSYVNGSQEGIYLKFNYDGIIKIKGEYRESIQTGRWEYYDRKGVLEISEVVHLGWTV